jgi:hypothetical protein
LRTSGLNVVYDEKEAVCIRSPVHPLNKNLPGLDGRSHLERSQGLGLSDIGINYYYGLAYSY